jgi:hypothetical protein
MQPPLFHPSLTGMLLDSSGGTIYVAELDYSKTRVQIPDEASWQAAVADEPCSPAVRRKQHARFIKAKLHSIDKELVVEGLHGLWELCIKRSFHSEVSRGVPVSLPHYISCLRRSGIPTWD